MCVYWRNLRICDQSHNVNSEIFERILFSRKALKDIFATLKNRDYVMIISKRQTGFAISRGLYFHEAKFRENKPLENFRIYSNAMW